MQVGASFSTGHVAPSHDFRKTHTPNVNPALSKDNVYLVDNLQGRTIDQYTNGKMQPIIDEYNSKQKRKDRRITEPYSTYFRKQPKNKGRSLSMEYVAQYGEHADLGGEYYSPDTTPERRTEIREEYISVYTKLLDNIREKYPHMEILYAVIHFDEPHGTPHLHIGVQPIGEGYAKGLSRQVSISKALEMDGIEKLKSRSEVAQEGGYQLARFYNRVRHCEFEPLLTTLGYTLKLPKPGRKHEPPSLYASGMAEIEEAREKAMEEVAQERATLDEERNALAQEKVEQQSLAEANLPDEIPIIERDARVDGPMGKLGRTETVSTVDPAAVREIEQQLWATHMELKRAQKRLSILEPIESAFKKIITTLLNRQEDNKLRTIWNICKELPEFLSAYRAREDAEKAAQDEAERLANVPAWTPPSYRKQEPHRQSRREPWGHDL